MFKIIVSATFLFFLMASCHFIGGERIRGNGEVSLSERPLTGFRGIVANGSFDVFLSYAPAHSVKVEAEENLQEFIETEIRNNSVHIGTRNGYNLVPREVLRIHIAGPDFTEIRTNGAGNIISRNMLKGSGNTSIGISGSGNIEMAISAPEIDAGISGSGTINLKGEAKKLHVNIMGNGDVEASGLKTGECSVRIAGSGSANLSVSEKLTVNVMGSGDVRYHGNPSVSQKIAGSGNIIKAD